MITLRPASARDLPGITALIPLSARGLSVGFYSDEEIESAVRFVFGPDTRLIEDGTYWVAEDAGALVGCGGWSRRATLYGGDQMKADDDPLLDPSRDAARIRAFFVHPDHRRRGIGGLILRACVNAAAEAGFRRLELMATLPGVPFYLRYGFEEIEPVRTRLPDGVEVRFVRMGRDLEEQPRLTSDPSNAMSRLNLELTPDQYAPFHVTYISNVADHDPLALLRGQVGRLEDALAGVSDERALHRYAPGKWSIKEVLGHIDDSERIFAYRLLRIARGDVTPLPGFDQNPYVEAGEFDSRPIEELLEDARATRRATLRLVDSIPPAAWGRRTVTAGAPVSARAMLWVIAGHAEHHLILLRERYGMELRNP